jgi:hypothetical protein
MSVKGAIHTIEALIAVGIMLGFVVFVYAVPPRLPEIDVRPGVYSALISVDEDIRNLAVQENITGLHTRIEQVIPAGNNISIALTTTDIYKNGNRSFEIPSNFVVDFGILHIFAINATSTAELNGNPIDLAGASPGDKVWINPSYFFSSNMFNVTELDYKLYVYRTAMEDLPERDLRVVDYSISGSGALFKPTKVVVYVW